MKPNPIGASRDRTRSRHVVALGLLVILGGACGQGETPTGDPLAGTMWEMTAVRDGGVTSPANPTAIATLVFGDGTASGSTGCNLFRSPYSIDEDSITFGDPALTGSACHSDDVDQSDAVIEALRASKRFAMSADQLELTDAGGTVQLQFNPADLLPLMGISWRLVWYGEGASPLDGTEISLAFRIDGTLTGDAGCNDYSSHYRTDGERLLLGPIAQTAKACLGPDGVMNQEAAYLDAIRQSAAFTTTLTSLELFATGGNPVAEFRFGGRIRSTTAGEG